MTGPADCSGFPPETLWWIAGLCKYKHTSHGQFIHGSFYGLFFFYYNPYSNTVTQMKRQ